MVAKPVLNLRDILTVDNIYRLEVLVLKFSHSWHNDPLPEVVYDNFKMLEIFIDIIRDIQPNRIL